MFDALKFIMNSSNMQKVKLKIFKALKLMSTTIFSCLLLIITFNNKFWKSHLDILHFLNYILLLHLGVWPKNDGFQYPRTFFWSTLSCLHLIRLRCSTYTCTACMDLNSLMIIHCFQQHKQASNPPSNLHSNT